MKHKDKPSPRLNPQGSGTSPAPHIPLFFLPFSFRLRALLVVIVSIALNINTIGNEYALDDEMVINNNMNVHRGFSGISYILTTDAYQGFLDVISANTPLSGGRYRPLSIVTFAIEEQLFGEPMGNEYWEARKKFEELQRSATDSRQVEEAAQKVNDIKAKINASTLKLAPVRHLFQVLWFALSMFVLFWFLHKYLLAAYPDIALLATLLFVFHPVHTEVVANVKSRDEIFSLLFIMLTCVMVFRYEEQPTVKNLVWTGLSAAGALLSKEYAILLPLIALSAVVLVKKKKIMDAVKSPWFMVLSLLAVLLLLVRQGIVGGNKKFSLITDVLNDPFMYATVQQKIATKIALLDQYLRLLLFPHPLSADYSFNHYPYLTFADWQVWLSIAVWGAIVFMSVKLWQQRHILAFACIFFLSFFMLVNNILFDIGATMGERLIYHSSLGFCIVVAWLVIKGTEKLQASVSVKQALVSVVSLLVLTGYGYKTIARNPDWKNDYTLFTRDVRYISNSALTNGNAGAQYYNKGYEDLKSSPAPNQADSALFLAYVDTAIIYLDRALKIHPRYVASYINRALCYSTKGNIDSAIIDWKFAASYFNGRHPSLIEHARMLLSRGKQLGAEKNYSMSSKVLRDASQIDAGNAEIWNNLGGSEFMQAKFPEAAQAFNEALAINPNLQDARMGAGAAMSFIELKQKVAADSLNPALWNELADAYRQANFTTLSEEAAQKSRQLK
jgi:hypothetical protein